MNWYYMQGDKQVGPVSDATLKELQACGGIENQTPIREETSQTWKTCFEALSGNRHEDSQVEFRLNCPACNQKFSAERKDIGKQATCSSCGTTFVIQAVETIPPPLPHQEPVGIEVPVDSAAASSASATSNTPAHQASAARQSPQPTNTASAGQATPSRPARIKGRRLIIIVIGSFATISILLIVVVGLIGALRESRAARLVDEADRIAFQTAGTPDWQKMVSLLRNAADRGNHEALFKLGTCYLYGRGVPKDPGEGARLFRKAADGGHAEAQYNLAVCYSQGQGVELSETEMLKWLKLAAEQELPQAQHSLGTLCMLGNAVPTDKKRGVELISLAAHKGIALAQYDLSLFYETGNGVPKDLVQAYKWATIATRNGFPGGQDALVELGKQMDPSQIREAEVLAEEWLPVKSRP
jgi:TPR repeat protein